MDSGDGRGGLLEYIKFMAAVCDGGQSEAATLMLVTERREGGKHKTQKCGNAEQELPNEHQGF